MALSYTTVKPRYAANTSSRSSFPGISSLAYQYPQVFGPQNFAGGAVPSASNIQYASPGLTGGMPPGYDIGSDPAVAAAHGLAEKIRANAQASALAKRKQAAIEYGDPTGVEGLDPATVKAAQENPYSILKNLEHTYTTGKEELEQNLNKANLFYGGYRGKQLSEAARAYQQNRYGAGSAFRGLMSDVNEQLANALLQADIYEQNALLNSSGGSYGGGDGGGGPAPYVYDPARPHPLYTAILGGRNTPLWTSTPSTPRTAGLLTKAKAGARF